MDDFNKIFQDCVLSFVILYHFIISKTNPSGKLSHLVNMMINIKFESIFSGFRIKIHCIFRYNFHHPMPIPIEVDYIFHVSYFPKKKIWSCNWNALRKVYFYLCSIFCFIYESILFFSTTSCGVACIWRQIIHANFFEKQFFFQSQLKMSFFESLAFTRIISRKETIRLSLWTNKRKNALKSF